MHLALGNQSLNLSNPSTWGSAGPSSAEGPQLVSAEESLGRIGLAAVSLCLGLILLLGCLSNLLVMLIFAKFQAIRTPVNLILLNISFCDLLVCVFGTPLSFASSLHGRWLLGRVGCQWYGFSNSLLGIVSLVSLSILSYERYVMVLQRHAKAKVSGYPKSWLCIATAWLYSLTWTLPPFFGWSSYGPEGPGVACSVTWHLRTPNNISYILCLFVFCLLFPLLAMMYCYGRILKTLRLVCRFQLTSLQKREHRILFMVVAMVSCYLFCWMPYGIVSLMTTFGKPGLITPAVSIIPSILAKANTCINPILYILLNRQFYKYFIILVKCGPPSQHIETTFEFKMEPRFSDSEQNIRHPLASATGQ